jgi:hypothetical protein
MNRKNYTYISHSQSNSEEIIGGHVVEKIPTDISMTINNFVIERPQKNRGVNIDIFLLKEPLGNLIKKKKIDEKKTSIKINKVQKSIINDSISKRCIIYYISYTELFNKYQPTDAFLLEIDDNAFCLISNYRRSDHDKICKRLYGKLFPSVNKAFLTSMEMYKVLSQMGLQGNYDLRVKFDFVRDMDLSRSFIEYFRSRKPEKLPTIDAIFEEKKLNKAYMRMMKVISISAKKKIGITFTGNGHIGIYDGTFDEIFDYLIVPTIHFAQEKLKNFDKRSMSERLDKTPLPIKLDFYTGIFESKDNISDFIEDLRDKYRRFSFSVVHGGNPHLFMYVMDRYDFSTFSIRSQGHNSLIITPQIKTSADSLMRFIQCIISLYPDGEINEVLT